jgi:multisubunit Na+/H+ antiporter MnhC subunit
MSVLVLTNIIVSVMCVGLIVIVLVEGNDRKER